ncbi:MAG: hypothetical protein WC878_07495 [Candidatus Paceibacterota bacterium]|jgi:hypothetical protein
MSAIIITCEEFVARREARDREREAEKLKKRLLTSPENRTEEEEMDIFAIVLDQLSEPTKKYPGSVLTQLSAKKETWETNPLAGILRNVAEFAGYHFQETLFDDRIATITIIKSEHSEEEDDE